MASGVSDGLEPSNTFKCVTKRGTHLAIESVFLNFHSVKCYYSAVQPSEAEPRSPKSSPRPHSEAAECRQTSAPQTITR